MDEEGGGRWISSDYPASAVAISPMNNHYKDAVRHLIATFETQPPDDSDRLGAPHSCAEVIENMMGCLRLDEEPRRKAGEWKFEALGGIKVKVQRRGLRLAKRLEIFWNQDKHGRKPGDAVQAYLTATPDFAVDVFNLTGALLAAYFSKQKGSPAVWILRATTTAGRLELRQASEGDLKEMQNAWDIIVSAEPGEP